jgi:hypothetical protein
LEYEQPEIVNSKHLTLNKTGDRPLQNRFNSISKPTRYAIDDPPPTLPVESYQSKHLFFQNPIGGLVVPVVCIFVAIISVLVIFFSFISSAS